MKSKGLFSTLATLTVGTVCGASLLMSPLAANATDLSKQGTLAGEHDGSGDKSCKGDKGCDGEKSCSGEKGCGGDKGCSGEKEETHETH
jgi:hypothetical protein